MGPGRISDCVAADGVEQVDRPDSASDPSVALNGGCKSSVYQYYARLIGY